VQPFLEFVERIYRGLPKTVTLLFSDKAAGESKEALAARAEQAQARAVAAQARAQQLAQAVAAAQAQAQTRAQQAAQLQSISHAQPTQQSQAQAAAAAQQAAQAQAQAQALNVQAQQQTAAAQQAQQLAAAAAAASAAAIAASAAAAAAPKPAEPTAAAPTAAAPADASGAAAGAAPAAARPASSGVLTRSTESFKVLTECPLIVMLLFQLYPRYIQSTIPALIPLMVNTLALPTPRRAVQQHRQVRSHRNTHIYIYILCREGTLHAHVPSVASAPAALFKLCLDSTAQRQDWGIQIGTEKRLGKRSGYGEIWNAILQTPISRP